MTEKISVLKEMKKLTLFLTLLAIGMMAQAQTNTNTYLNVDSIGKQFKYDSLVSMDSNSYSYQNMIINNFRPAATITIIGSTDSLNLWVGDSLRITGNMPLTEAAKKFFNALNEITVTRSTKLHYKIDSLKRHEYMHPGRVYNRYRRLGDKPRALPQCRYKVLRTGKVQDTYK